MTEIRGTSLTTCQIAPDGSTIRLSFETGGGQTASITLPIRCIQQLLMTLPHAASMAIRAKHGDDRMRLVFPLGNWNLEKAAGTPEGLILTLKTPDGFEVSFSLEQDAIKEMSSTAEARGAARAQDRSYLN
jgi:hypothetical protein